MTPEQLNKWSIDHGHPRKISPGRRFADELRLGESGNRWLQAQCALGTGEARRRRVRHLQRCHCSDNGKGLNRQRRRVANLACNTGLAMRRVRWGRVAGAGVAGAIGNCRFGARRVGMHRRRCPRFMGMRNRRHRHLHRHCVPHPAAQRQQGDHQSEQYMAHARMIAAMKESSLQWVIRRCIRDAMPLLHQLWPVRGEGCPSRFQLMFGAHAGQTETGSPSYVRALSGLQGCPISSEWMRAGVRSTSSFRAAHQDRVRPLPDMTLMPPSGAQRQLSLAAYASPHANVCVHPNGKYKCSATQKSLSSPRF